MSAGRPDFHPTMLLEGKSGTSLIPVLVDALGQLYTIISGNYGGAPTPILLDAAGRILAHLVGSDGGTIRDVSVDVNGNIIARIRGKDGGGALQDVLLDTSGNMQTVVKGDYSGTLKTVAVDTNGVLKANLSAQDLNYLKVRPVYGGLNFEAISSVAIPNSTWTEIKSVTGKGAVISGRAYFGEYFASAQQQFRFKIDGVAAGSYTVENLNSLNYLPGQGSPMFIAFYNDVSYNYKIGFGPGITFETSFAIEAYQNSGAAKTGYTNFFYALVP